MGLHGLDTLLNFFFDSFLGKPLNVYQAPVLSLTVRSVLLATRKIRPNSKNKK
jgi:hypothetical protein